MAITSERVEDTFDRLVEPHRRGLHAHCYRMLGSLHDAEDAYQEALLRAWRSHAALREDGAARGWLYRIATNVCLNAIARRPKRVLPADHGPAWDPRADPGGAAHELLWLDPYPEDPDASYEEREAVELAFIAALQHLPAHQRAALILREVLGFSARETADALDFSVAAVNSALQRARRTVDERLPARSQQQELGDERSRELVRDYMDAWERDDVPAIVALLADDVIVEMPPWAAWWQGRDAVAELLDKNAGTCFEALRIVPLDVNGQLGFASYGLKDGRFEPLSINVVTVRDGQIAASTGFVRPELFDRFGLEC